MEEFGTGRAPGLGWARHKRSPSPAQPAPSRDPGAVAEPAPEPEAVQPQQPRMVPHLIKAVERQG